jgi:hypothetical protein
MTFRNMRYAKTIASIAAAGSLICSVAGVADAQQIPPGFASKPIFDEEFNGPALNPAVWSYRGTGRRAGCMMNPAAVAVRQGYVRIRIFTGPDGQHVCGAITTPRFNHAFGYWEASVRYGYQPGMQSAFWIQSPNFGHDPSPEKSGVEIDVFEHTAGTTQPLGFQHNLIWGGYGPSKQHAGQKDALPILADGKFHRFGVAWTPAGYSFYVDGRLSWSSRGTAAPVSHAPQFIILDTELPRPELVPSQGYGPLGAPTNAHLDVDYVRVYPFLG